MASDFEFQALRLANNYRSALLREFASCLHGDVVEVGAGIGQFTDLIQQLRSVRHVLTIEPDSRFCVELRRRFRSESVVEGTIFDLPRETGCDALVSINVLEHIQNDEGELAAYARLLGSRRGCLCLFVPARQEIYAQIDHDFGHYRRYSKRGLSAKLRQAGFQISRLHYFNSLGYLLWLLNFRLLRKRSFSAAAVWFFDRAVFPPINLFERHVIRPPLGQSLLAIARPL